MRDTLVVKGFKPVDIGNQGDVTWRLDPYHHPMWTQWLHGLRWLGELIESKDPAHLARAEKVVQDWVHDNDPTQLSQGARAATPERVNVLVCLQQRVGPQPWLARALDVQAQFLRSHYSGDWNHGLDQNAALFTVGCLSARTADIAMANRRLTEMAPKIVDAQGVSNEQAPGYHAYVYRRLAEIEELWSSCAQALPATLATRHAKMPDFIAQATLPNGSLVQLGDTEAKAPKEAAGTVADYVMTGGSAGQPPQQRVGVYDAGYVFGRDHWSAFRTSTHYSLRFGPPRNYHGHFDHGALTWWALGHPLLIDTGHVGYEQTWRREHVRSREAHNKLVAPGLAVVRKASTLSRRSVTGAADVFELTVPEYDGVTWKRTVLFAGGDPRVVVVYDRMPTSRPKLTRQYWHLPVGSRVTVSGGRADARSGDAKVRTRIVQVPLPGQSLPTTTVVTGRGGSAPLGWYARGILQWQKAPVVVAERREAKTRQLTVVTASPPSAALATRLAPLGSGRYQLTVTLGGQRLVVHIGADGWMTRV
jgi:hypothetical protein